MKAITIWQPWASLIIAGVKPNEFRRWKAHSSLVGQRIAIHAGARICSAEELAQIIGWIHKGHPIGLGPLAEDYLIDWLANRERLPLGAVIGSAVLGKPIENPDGVNDSDRITECAFAWPMLDPRPIEPILPYKGSQGFWNLPYELGFNYKNLISA